MDLFKFNNTPMTGDPSEQMRMHDGIFITNTISKTWIERYGPAGEFTIVAKVSSGLKDILTRGSFLSHVDTTEIMMVESQEINDDGTAEPTVTITGRSFESYLENRVVGSNTTFPVYGIPAGYSLVADNTWTQIVKLISDHILAANLVDDNDAIPYFEVMTNVPGSATSEVRAIQPGDVYSRVLDIIAVDNLGIKVIRPGPTSPALDPANSVILVYKGVDLSSTVVLSYGSKEIVNVDYLWSIKPVKNTAMVLGTWVQVLVTTVETGYNRRMMIVDATDVDSDMDSPPTGDQLTDLYASLQTRGVQALAAQKEVALVRADVDPLAVKSIFRKDYNLGDIITVDGDFDESAKMRVTEYVEIEDETGNSGHPTLSAI